MKIKVDVQFADKNGIQRHRTIELNQDSCLIGRGTSDIVVLDPKCSLHHVILFEDEAGNLNLVDLRSTNGTLLNGERVVKKSIQVGDLLHIGDTTIRLLEFTPKYKIGGENELTRWEFPIITYNES